MRFRVSYLLLALLVWNWPKLANKKTLVKKEAISEVDNDSR
jgi:hypothetical protein